MAHEDYSHPEYLVEPEWLAAHKDDANVVVVDCDVDAAYNRGHIPGRGGGARQLREGPGYRTGSPDEPGAVPSHVPASRHWRRHAGYQLR